MRSFKYLLAICALSGVIVLCGCQLAANEQESGEELEFTVMEKNDIPSELQDVILENQQNEIRMSYLDGGYLYIVRGYGEQSTGGYSIRINGVWLREDGIHVDTSLLGPASDKEIKEESSYPYLVLKMEQRDNEVFFD